MTRTTRRTNTLIIATLLALALPCLAAADDGGLTLQAIEVRGNDRTSSAVVARQLGLSPGQPVDGALLTAAVEDLRRRELFSSVAFHTRPGDERGAVVLVLDVVERGPDLRFGTGRSDLDGWYLIPVELSLDNALGRGEEAAVLVRLGYRHSGLAAHYREGTAPGDTWRWGLDLSSLTTDRVYFDGGVEYAHRVERQGFGLTLGRRLGRAWSLETALRLEGAEADSTGEVWQNEERLGAVRGDEVAFADLPVDIAAAVGRRERTLLRADLVLDTRAGQCAGAPARGVWGRLRLQRTAERDGGGFGAASADLRLYRPAGGGVLACRALLATVGRDAPFYDRLYLGGLYSVRGVPSQSLSAPGGGTWSWLTSLEYRAALIGGAADPRLAGALFVDAGRAGGPGDAVAGDTAASMGWGLRWRLLPDVRLGFDVAVPLAAAPADESWHAHAALGWTF
ncbi:MAG: BamA/TamA family outer membrane protein [Candidatus Latescibacteria bacterium]|nr:BamA/TamA family outer membrane protein [Candidatus Latescibacterota bacterium]